MSKFNFNLAELEKHHSVLPLKTVREEWQKARFRAGPFRQGTYALMTVAGIGMAASVVALDVMATGGLTTAGLLKYSGSIGLAGHGLKQQAALWARRWRMAKAQFEKADQGLALAERRLIPGARGDEVVFMRANERLNRLYRAETRHPEAVLIEAQPA